MVASQTDEPVLSKLRPLGDMTQRFCGLATDWHGEGGAQLSQLKGYVDGWQAVPCHTAVHCCLPLLTEQAQGTLICVRGQALCNEHGQLERQVRFSPASKGPSGLRVASKERSVV